MPLLETLEVLEEEAEAKTQAQEEGEIYELRDSLSHPGFCEYFVFFEMLKEPWARDFDEREVIAERFQSPCEFLFANGYEEADFPQDNDVIAYLSQKEKFHHWGIFKDGKVISRFGSGPIRRHKIQGTRYGNKAVFFRKQKREAAA